MKIVRPCWRPSSVDEDRSDDDRLLWCKDIGHHVAGDFSMAVVQANNLLEDSCQIESGPLISNDTTNNGTFVGVFDGHGGPETSRFITDNLFQNLKKFASEQGGMSVDVIKRAYSATEEGFLSIVKKQWLSKPQIASVGSCCLVAVICGGMLYVANVGDSRAVLGSWSRGERELSAIQMSTEHNASNESVREELKSLHPDDPQIVVLKHKVWRVKGIIQISRSIGDAYLKEAEFNREPLAARFRLPEPFQKSILSAEPSVVTHKLCPQDQFLIFASDGLWEHMSNQEAADIVHNSPRNGIYTWHSWGNMRLQLQCDTKGRILLYIFATPNAIAKALKIEMGVAKRLIRAALKEAAKKREMRYSDLKKIGRGVRRHFHDDISVIVLYLDPVLIRKTNYNGPALSLSRCGDSVQTDSTIRKF